MGIIRKNPLRILYNNSLDADEVYWRPMKKTFQGERKP